MSHGQLKNYTPIWTNMTDSSVWSEPLHVRVLWVTMLLHKDKNCVVWGNSYVLHRKANIPLEDVEDALKVLSSPDRLRPGQKFGGRRIEAVEGGWRILNGEEYQRAYQLMCAAGRAKRYRAKKLGKPLPGETAYVRAEEKGAPKEVLDRLADPSVGKPEMPKELE